MTPQLTAGALQTIMTGGEVVQPVMQILGRKKLAGNAETERYRLLVSDGVHLNTYAMLATQLNDKLYSGELDDNTIVRIDRHIVSMLNNQQKRVIIILDLTVLMKGSEVKTKIGNPVPYVENAPTVNGNTAAPPAPVRNDPPAVSAQPAAQPKPQFNSSNRGGNRSFGSTNSTQDMQGRTHPISGLTPYQNKWIIKARVTSKSPIRSWSNARGEGKLFSMDLVDESGEIRATAFRDQCDKYYDMIEVNKVYYISKCQLKTANKQFSNLNNDYEMTFTHDTQVVPCADDSEIPQITYNFVPLSVLQNSDANAIVDVIGVCKSANDIQNLTARTSNRELKKRDITLVDQSLTAATVTLWGTQAEEFDGSTQPVVAIKGGRITEFSGAKSISLVGSSVLNINPDIEEAHKLRGWFDCLTDDANFNSVSLRSGGADGIGSKCITLKEAKDSQLGGGDKADYYNTFATVVHIRTENSVYKACPAPDCNKKVIDQNTGMYRCEKCNREYDNFKWRLMLSAQIADWTGSQWLTLFHETAEAILGTTADEVGNHKESNENYQDCFKQALFHQFLFRLRAKMENYNDETRLKVVVQSVKVPDYKDYCRRMISEIKEMSGITIGDN